MDEPWGVAARDRGTGAPQHAAATPRSYVRGMYWLVRKLVSRDVARCCSATLLGSCNAAGGVRPDPGGRASGPGAKAAATGGLMVETRVRFGFTATPGTTDDARMRRLAQALP